MSAYSKRQGKMTLPYYPVLRLTETEDLQPSMSTQWGLTRGEERLMTEFAVSVVPCKQLGKEMALVDEFHTQSGQLNLTSGSWQQIMVYFGIIFNVSRCLLKSHLILSHRN